MYSFDYLDDLRKQEIALLMRPNKTLSQINAERQVCLKQGGPAVEVSFDKDGEIQIKPIENLCVKAVNNGKTNVGR